MKKLESELRSGLPLLYVAVLAGLVAAFCLLFALGLEGIASDAVAPFLSPSFLFAPASAYAAVIMIFFGLPAHALIVQVRLARPWTYAVAMLVILSFAFLLLFGSLFGADIDLVAAIRDPAGSLLLLVPIAIAAIPSGIFFYALAHRAEYTAPFDRRDAAIIATCFGAWIMMFVTFRAPFHFKPDPLYTRAEIMRLASTYETGGFMLSGLIAGLTRLRSLRLGSLIALAGWLIPLSFSVFYFATPLGPEKIRFVVADQTFVLDWHLDPRSEEAGFSFEAAKRGSDESWGRHQINRRLYISDMGKALSPLWPIPSGRESGRQWIEAGLTCEEQGIEDKFRRICVAGDGAGRTATLIDCRRGYCFHRFDHDGLRYGLHIDPDDLSHWMEIQKRAVQVLADVNQAH